MLCWVHFCSARYAATYGPKPDNAPARNRLTPSRPRKLASDGDGSIASATPAESAALTILFEAPRRSAMDQHRNFAMGEDLDRLAAEDERGDAVAAMRGHDDEVAAFRFRRIDDRAVGMFILGL